MKKFILFAIAFAAIVSCAKESPVSGEKDSPVSGENPDGAPFLRASFCMSRAVKSMPRATCA